MAPPLLTIGALEFRWRLWPALAAALGVALTIALDTWQLGRAHDKEALQQRAVSLAGQPALTLGAQAVDAADIALRRVEARGRYDPAHAVYIDNQVYRGRAGYHVIMPLRIAGSGKHVLVNRGWLAAPRERGRVLAAATPDSEVVVRGVARPMHERFIELSPRVAEGNVWQNLTLERFRAATGLDAYPFVIYQDSAADDGLAREWSPPDFGRDTHLAYAFQWFTLAAAVAAIYIALNVRRRTQVAGPH